MDDEEANPTSTSTQGAEEPNDDGQDNSDTYLMPVVEEPKDSNPRASLATGSFDEDTSEVRMKKAPGENLKGENERREYFILSFENLTVYVPGVEPKCCNCIDSPLRAYGQEYMGLAVDERDPFYALTEVSGYCKSGEMVLVLGPNDSSKSTLLRALCGRLNSQDELSGTVLLNGVPVGKSNQGWRRMSPYVSASDSSHSPVLTVKETLTFAAQCTSDGKQTAQQIEDRVTVLMEALGIDHVADTIVGDVNLRGVSGGQKRRVTVGEMMTDPNSSFFCYENITDGLASTDSFSLIQRLSSTCHKLGVAGIVSLLQPSDEMVQLFDKLLVLSNNGEMVYFGPVDRKVLRPVFLEPEAEDLGSICDLVLSHSLDESKEDTLVKQFVSTKTYSELQIELAKARGMAPPARQRNLDTILPDKKYSTSRWYQLKIIILRRLKLIARNAVTYTRIGIAVLFGVIIGSLFGQLNVDVMGSLARTGYMFLNCFLVLMLSSAVILPEAFRQRPTLFKHRSAEFFSGRVSYFAQVLCDIPLSILEASLLACISYYWVDMNSPAGNFFYFWAVLIGLESVGQAFGRLLCALMRQQVSANALSTVCILTFGTVAGFMPSYVGIPWVLRWLSWLTPVSYAFEGLMINQFAGETLGGVTISGTDGSSTIGNISGNAWLSIFDIPRARWGTDLQIMGFDLAMLFLFATIYDSIGLYYVERTREWYHNQIRRPQARVKSLEISPMQSMQTSRKPEEDAAKGSKPDTTWPQTLSVRDLSYSVPFKSKHEMKRFTFRSLCGPCLVKCSGNKPGDDLKSTQSMLTLLHNVDARFQRGRMTSLMGTSGAGKTTLLDVIAGYKTGGHTTGEIMIDGQPKVTRVWKKICGYAEQQDILNPYLSVLETLRFTASCRLRGSFEDREKVITQVVRLMALEEWVDVMIGREADGEGLPKHARKRVTIAIQLVGEPRILFLDEPTTGLGSTAASLVINAIRRATDELGLITLATIHQPSSRLWSSFDDLILLAKGGRVAYMGEIGGRSVSVLDHFATFAQEDPPGSINPADYVLATLTDLGPDEAQVAFKKKPQYEALLGSIEEDKNNQGKSLESVNTAKINSRWNEFLLVALRQLMVQWRNPSFTFMRVIWSTLMSFYMGVLFFGEKTTLHGAVSTIGAIFFLVFVLVIPTAASVVPLIEDRAVLYRETVSGTYSRFSYGLGSLVADIPFHALNAILMFVAFYFLVDFRIDGGHVGYFILLIFMANWVVVSMGQLYALVSPNEESAHGLTGISIILSVILMGFLITVNAMPSYWEWAYWANLFHYIIQGFVTNELKDQTYHLDLNITLPNITNPADVILFEPGIDPMINSVASQSATFVGLVAAAGPGTNPFGTIEDIKNLLQCLVENDCLKDPISINFLWCTVGGIGRPKCGDEFQNVTESVDIEEIAKCFAPSFDGEPVEVTDQPISRGAPSDFSIDRLNTVQENDRLEMVLCILRALLPDVFDIIEKIVEIIKQLWGIVLVLVHLLENGIDLPGEIILFFFGWAELREGSLEAPFKWHYCLTAVASFLLGIELLKLLAVRFIVWTKR